MLFLKAFLAKDLTENELPYHTCHSAFRETAITQVKNCKIHMGGMVTRSQHQSW